MAEEMLEIVDENDNVVGMESRKKIHANGLLHREAHVVFVTPKREFIFQRRSKTKDSYPGLLDVTVGGHVEIGDSYEQTAFKEAFEETSVRLDASKIFYVTKLRNKMFDEVKKVTNNRFCMVFGHVFTKDLDYLVAEQGKIDGFEVYSYEAMLNMSNGMKKEFIDGLIGPDAFYMPIFEKIVKLVS